MFKKFMRYWNIYKERDSKPAVCPTERYSTVLQYRLYLSCTCFKDEIEPSHMQNMADRFMLYLLLRGEI